MVAEALARRPDIRAHILDTAFALLADHGIAYLTQPRVSKAAGVRQSHLTYYFPTRGDLLVAVARYSIEILADPLLDQAQRGALTFEQMPAILTQALTDRRRIRAVLGLVVTADEDPAVREALREMLGLVRARFGEVFAAMGCPKDPASLALIHAIVVGAAVLNHARADDEGLIEAEAAARFIVALLPTKGECPIPAKAECPTPTNERGDR